MGTSTLNPNAPIFLPMKSYLTVEDFSPQWWDLVHSSPFFRDYWLQDSSYPNDDFTLTDLDALFAQAEEEYEKAEEKKERSEKEIVTMASLKWSKGSKVESNRSFQKVPKIVKSVRVNPRTIHQPR